MCFIILFLGTIRFSPKVATYASNFKVLKPIVKWITGIDRGIGKAKESGYPSLEAISYSEDGYAIKLNNMFIDEERFFVTVEISGPEIERLSREYENLNISSLFKRDVDNYSEDMSPRYIYDIIDGRLLTSFELELSHGFSGIFKNSSSNVSIKLALNYFDYGDKENKLLHTFKPINFTMDKDKVLKSKIYPIEGEFEYKAGKFKLKSLNVSPTRMKLNIHMDEVENYNFKSLENFYFTDSKGNIYKPEGMISSISGRAPNTDNSRNVELYFVPSIYFEEDIKELTFHTDGLRYNLLDESIVKLALYDSYPKKKIYMGEEITFSKPFRNEEGNLIVEFEVRNSEKFDHVNLQLSVEYGPYSKVISRERTKITKDGREILKCEFIYDVPEDDLYEFNINGLGYYERKEIDIPIKLNK